MAISDTDAQARMAVAYAELVAAGRRPTVRALQTRAHVGTHVAAAYLRSKRQPETEGDTEPPLPGDLATAAADAATAQCAALWTVALEHARRAAHYAYAHDLKRLMGTAERLRRERDEAREQVRRLQACLRDS